MQSRHRIFSSSSERRIRVKAFGGLIAVIGLLPAHHAWLPRAHAAETKPLSTPSAATAQKPSARLSVWPAKIALHGPRDRQQLLATNTNAAGHPHDVTDRVVWQSSATNVVRINNAIAIPAGNGTAVLTAHHYGRTRSISVTVTGFTEPQPVSFQNEVLAALTKAGCNMGACHGSPSGKAGFRLSLRGFDAPLDRLTLRQEVFGRRINRMDPAASLMLRKPLMEVAHGGGKRLRKHDAAWKVLHNWIAEGASVNDAHPRTLERMTVTPASRVFHENADQQQLAVTGDFSDGTQADITALTSFSSSSEDVATVSPSGRVEKLNRGETVILARYLDQMATSSVTFLEDVPGFQWQAPPTVNFIDELVFNKLQRLQIQPSELTSDAEFLRRVYLDVTGRLPIVAETQKFLANNAPNKRARLIDALLLTPDYAEFWALRWADVLRVNSEKLKPQGVQNFHRWLIKSVANDKPFHEFAQELLTSTGSVFENPAASYWRVCRDPQDATETTAQLFLGIRMQCAKCHNHPFERWSQDNYFGIAAAFVRVGYKESDIANDEIVFVKPGGEVKQPRTGQRMKVHLLLQGDVDVPTDVDRRQVFADWLTHDNNPFFAKASVNRIWGHLFGRGLVDPVDDFRDSNPATNNKLLSALAAEFVRQRYSRRELLRTILNSRTYQLSAKTNEFNRDDRLYHSHARPRLLSAEQLLDAISQVTGVPEEFPGMPAGTRAVSLPEPPAEHNLLKAFGQPAREMACQCERTTESNLSQAMQLINGPVLHQKLRADNNRIDRLLQSKLSDEQRITELYVAAVCRNPAPAEMTTALKHLAQATDRRQAVEDVCWALMNTKEFLFQH